jgi:hypothetical protein
VVQKITPAKNERSRLLHRLSPTMETTTTTTTNNTTSNFQKEAYRKKNFLSQPPPLPKPPEEVKNLTTSDTPSSLKIIYSILLYKSLYLSFSLSV